MATASQDIRQSLLAHDAEFQRLTEEHSRCELQLKQILKQSYLSAEDLLQEANLKKTKLYIKDRMEMIVARYQRGQA